MLESRLNILRLLNEHEGISLNSRDMVRILAMNGTNVAERTVRYHLKILEQSGLVEHSGKSSRHITMRGKDAVKRAFGSEIAFVRNRFYNMACLTSYDQQSESGTVVLSTFALPAEQLVDALAALKIISETPLMAGDRIIVATEGQSLDGEYVPAGTAIIGIVNSATSLGIMIRHGIPVLPSYIGLLEVKGDNAERFSSIIGLQAVTEDVLSIYLASGATNVYSSLYDNRGKLIAMFLEIPSACYEPAKKLAGQHELINIITVGLPGTRLLDVSVEPAKAGVVLNDNINALAFLKECGITIYDHMHLMTYDYSDMLHVEEAARKYSRKRFANVPRA